MKAELIYQDYNSNEFWRITVDGKEHTITFGLVGRNGQSKTKVFADEGEALKNAQKLILAVKEKGYKDAAKVHIVRDNYVFANKPIKDFGSIMNPTTAVKVLSGYDDKLKVVDKLDKLAKLPNIGEMDTLVIGVWQEAYDLDAYEILEKLIELKDTFSGLKHLFIGDMNAEECEMSWIAQANYSNFHPHFPALETFGVRGGTELKLGEINLPNLKNLIIESGGLDKEIISDIVKSNLENLEHLEIWLGTENYGCTIKAEDLLPILNGNYPNLKYLGLKNYHQQDDLAEALQGASILATIEILDLSMGTLTDKGAAALHNNEALLNLKYLNCRHHFISDEWEKQLEEKFVAQNINLTDGEDPYQYDEEAYYYVEIGE